MKILGIHYSHDSGAAIIEDGRILAAVNEERLNRKKLYWGFPALSIKSVFQIANLEPKDIDYVAFANITPGGGVHDRIEKMTLRIRLMNTIAQAFPQIIGSNLFAGTYRAVYSQLRKGKSIVDYIRKIGVTAPVKFIEHHQCHAASAFYTSQFDKDCLILTTDGTGDGYCASTSVVNDDYSIKRVAETPFFHSPASIYAYVTYNLGFTPNKHEGKITGLAAYGKPEKTYDIFRKIMGVNGLQYKVKGLTPGFFYGGKKLHKMLQHKKWDDIAAGLQKRFEEVIQQLIGNSLKKYPRSALALAGGAFANVKANQRVAEIPGINKVYIHPHMGDGGLAVGAALQLWAELMLDKGKMPKPIAIDNVYFGPEFSEGQMQNAMQKAGLRYKEYNHVETEIASLLKEKKIIGRFDGRMEYGPRALGNRSILADPTDKFINDWLNKRLHRCYDEETEVLTINGWKYLKDILDNEIIATFNSQNNRLEFHRINKKISYQYNGKMFHLKNKRIDLVVTPNHNVWVKKKHGKTFGFMKIDEVVKIKTYHFQKKGGVDWEGKEEKYFILANKKIPMDLWLEFLGYYLAEGSCYYTGYGHYRISIGQSINSKHFNCIKNCLKKIHKTTFYDIKEFIINNKVLFSYVKQFGKAKDKFVPREFLSMSKRQLSILFYALMRGDGNIRGKGYRYATTSKLLAENVQEIAIKLGFSAYLSKQKKSENPKHNQLCMVRIGRSPVATVRSYQIKKVNYRGKVYCVNVENHLILVRRNGKTVFSGNSEFMPFGPSLMKEFAKAFYKNFEPGEIAAQFMTITFDATEEGAKKTPAVTHVDNTARPQTVTKEQNKSYYEILKAYKDVTGLPIFVNTSYNIHEEPIVCSPEDAIQAFKDGSIDVLAMGNFLAWLK